MRQRTLWAALLIALLPSLAFAACNPSQSPPGSFGCQPPLGTPQATDLVPGWRPNIFPNSLGTYSMSDLSAYISSATGFVRGPNTTTVGHLATWANIAGTQLADTSLLTVSLGGSGAATFTQHGILIGEGTSAFNATAAMTNGQLLVGQTGADPAPETMSGDATFAAGGALTLATVNSNTGSWGDATHVPQITLNAKGLATAASSVLITGTTPGGSAGGDLSGSYPNPTVAKVNGVTHPSSPSVNTVPVVTSASGGGTVTYEAVPNNALQNSTITVNSTTCTLGSTCTIATSTAFNTATGVATVAANFGGL